ncbi:H+/nucleoside cotransporter [Xylariaceae sp. FL1019]|nr:H+/nucleoside cotransporter [Xylariaceae sp. FL1019]
MSSLSEEKVGPRATTPPPGVEHTHPHLHHGGAAAKPANHDDEVTYMNTAPDGSYMKNKGDFAMGEKTFSTDEESGNASPVRDVPPSRMGVGELIAWSYRKYRAVYHLAVWLLFTAWWIYGLVKFRKTKNWLIPFLVYLAITLRIITLWIPVSYVMRPTRWLWYHSVFKAYEAIPKAFHQPLAAIGTVGVFLIGSMVPAEEGDNTRASRAQSLFGLIVMIAVMSATSKNFRAIPWHTVIGGMLTQFIIAIFVLKSQAGYDIFKFISDLAGDLLGFANDGVTFLTNDSIPELHWFLTGVIPAIIFFISLISLLFHVGLVQWFIGKFSVFFFWSLRISGAEAVVAAATPFIGQGESAMLVRPFVPHLTMSEMHTIMCCGFATISGSVLVAYIGLGLNAQALVSSCIMSIPASIAVSKMRYPEMEEPLSAGHAVIPEDPEHKASNAIHAFANGAWLGLKIGGMIVATLLCIIAFVGLINGLLTWWGSYWGIQELTLQFILGYIFYPVAWLLGVPKGELLQVGELIGMKVITNEFVAFNALSTEPRYTALSSRATLIATYACCGFGNVGSLGTQIGVLSQVAPHRGGDVSKLALSALAAGVVTTLSSATIAGMLYTSNIK